MYLSLVFWSGVIMAKLGHFVVYGGSGFVGVYRSPHGILAVCGVLRVAVCVAERSVIRAYLWHRLGEGRNRSN